MPKSFDQCVCDPKVGDSIRKVSDFERQMDERLRDISSLEGQLKQIDQNKYRVLNFQYYLQQNSKLGQEGKIQGIEPEKTYEEMLEENNFDDKNMVWMAELGDFDPCFYFCSGKYQHNMHQVN
jgi:hypothetical protein